MIKIIVFSILLLLGLFFSQFIGTQEWITSFVKHISLILLAFIMIHVGLEFSIKKRQLTSYAWDYFVAFMAASLPWIFCSIYFVYFFEHNKSISQFDIWANALLLALFAAPTSAGILFTMLAAADLENTWVYKKARILAIFDDINTIILLIPIKMMMVGFKIESFIILFAIGTLLYIGWKKMHSFFLPIYWYWILFYSIIVTTICELILYITETIEAIPAIHIEVLIPAFILGFVLAYPKGKDNIHAFLAQPTEKKIKFLIGAIFLFFVGLSMPSIQNLSIKNSHQEILPFAQIFLHVLAITLLSNIGKMFPLFCYRKEATLKERIALSIGMCPRGEVGAGIIVISLAVLTKINTNIILISIFSLILNLILTGPFIICIKELLVRKKKINQ